MLNDYIQIQKSSTFRIHIFISLYTLSKRIYFLQFLIIKTQTYSTKQIKLLK